MSCPSCEAVTSCRVVKWYLYLLYLRIKRIALRQRDGTSYLLPRARLRTVPVVQRAGDLLPTSHVQDRKSSDSTLSWSDETINLSHHECSVSVQRHFIKTWHKLSSVTRPRTLGNGVGQHGLWPAVWNDKPAISDGRDQELGSRMETLTPRCLCEHVMVSRFLFCLCRCEYYLRWVFRVLEISRNLGV